MARLFSSGFELNSLTAGMEFTTIAGSSLIQTSVVRSGTYAAQITGLTSLTPKGFAYQFSSGGANPSFYRFYIRVATLPLIDNTIFGVGSSNTLNGATFEANVKLTSTGTLKLSTNFDGLIGTSSLALSLNQWYRIEVKLDGVPAAGSRIGELKIDGAVAVTSSALGFTGSNLKALQIGGNIGGESQTVGNWYFDDLAVNDHTGTQQTGYPGYSQILHLNPNAAGDNNTFATQVGGTAGSANNYTRVNEIPPNDATSYNRASAANQIDDFNITDTPAAIATGDEIDLVAVGLRYADSSTSVAGGTLNARIKAAASGTVVAGSTITVLAGGSYRTNSEAAPHNYGLVSYVQPSLTIPWTKAKLDTAQIGYTAPTVSAFPTVTNAWLLVEWSPTAITYDATASAKSPAGSSATSLTFAHVVGTGSNTKLIVSVNLNDSNQNACTTAVTYGGVAMTKAVTANNTGDCRSEIWYLDSPTTGSNNVVVTLTGGSVNQIEAAATSIFNAASGAPEATASAINTSANLNIQATITTVSDQAWIFDACMYESVPLAMSDQRSMWTQTGQSFQNSAGGRIIASPAGAYPVSYKGASSATGSLAVVSIAPHSSSVTTTQTQSATSRITASTTKLQTAITRITASTQKFATALARLTVSTLKPQTGISRITAVTQKFQSATSRITAVTQQIQTITSRLTVTTVKTVSVVANLLSAVVTSSSNVTNKGKALIFNGTSSVITLGTNPTSVVDNFTIVAWIKPTLPQTTGMIVYIGDDGGGWGLAAGNTSDGSGSNIVALMGGVAWLQSGATLTNGVWQQVAIVRSSGTLTFYVNGVAVGTTFTNTPAAPTSGRASIGAELGASGGAAFRFFTGNIDEAKIYSRALTVSELLSNYNSGVGVYGLSTETNIVGLYHFDEGSGTTAIDSSSSANNGTITSATYTTGIIPLALTAVSRITAAAIKTIASLSRITAKTLKLQSAVANIVSAIVTTTKVQTALARLTVVTTKLQAVVSRITHITAQTQAALSRLTASTQKTIAGVARLTAKTLRLQSAVARLTNTTLKTITAITRIAVLTTKTQTAVSRLALITTKTITSLARIALITNKTITSVARLTATTLKVQSTLSRITATTVKVQSVVTRITAKTIKTIATVSRITASTLKVQSALARITATTIKVQTALTRITAKTLYLQNALARLTAQTQKTITALARLTVKTLKLQTALSHITALGVKTQTTITRITKVTGQVQAALASILSNVSTNKVTQAIARITALTLRTTTSLARITRTSLQTITVISRIGLIALKTQAAVARLTTKTQKTIATLARLTAQTVKTQPAIARLGRVVLKTISTVSRLTNSTTKTITNTARITIFVVRTQPTISRITRIVSKTVSATARLFVVTIQNQPTAARIAKLVTRVTSGLARIQQTVLRSQTALARLFSQRSKTQQATATILATRRIYKQNPLPYSPNRDLYNQNTQAKQENADLYNISRLPYYN